MSSMVQNSLWYCMENRRYRNNARVSSLMYSLSILWCPIVRVVEVDWGLTSHSAIFQLYSDGTDVQFPNFDLLPGTQRHGHLGVFSVPSLPRHGHRDVQRRLLPPCHQRAHTRWGNLLCYHLSSQSWSIVCSCDRDWTFKVYHGGNDTCMDHKERVNPIVFQGQKWKTLSHNLQIWKRSFKTRFCH